MSAAFRSLRAATVALFLLPMAGAASAQVLTSVSVSASMRLPMFATTAPVVETVRFATPTVSDVAQGWSYATNSTLLSSDANVPHVVTVVALSGCGDPGGGTDDDDAAVRDVEWSSDGGRSWHTLAFEPAPVGPREPAGHHAASQTIRYRRRVDAVAPSCRLQLSYTAMPAN